MQIEISVRHGELSAATKEKISEKVERLRRYFDRVNAISVTADLEHATAPVVEIQVSIEHCEDIVTKASGANVLAALDAALHKAEQQLRKVKERIIDSHRSAGRTGRQSPPPLPES